MARCNRKSGTNRSSGEVVRAHLISYLISACSIRCPAGFFFCLHRCISVTASTSVPVEARAWSGVHFCWRLRLQDYIMHRPQPSQTSSQCSRQAVLTRTRTACRATGPYRRHLELCNSLASDLIQGSFQRLLRIHLLHIALDRANIPSPCLVRLSPCQLSPPYAILTCNSLLASAYDRHITIFADNGRLYQVGKLNSPNCKADPSA